MSKCSVWTYYCLLNKTGPGVSLIEEAESEILLITTSMHPVIVIGVVRSMAVPIALDNFHL